VARIKVASASRIFEIGFFIVTLRIANIALLIYETSVFSHHGSDCGNGGHGPAQRGVYRGL
jgi:hypothetical protein